MSSLNPSAPYGYYGAVAPGEVYFPPETYTLVYRPSSAPFTQEDLSLLMSLTASTSFQTFMQTNAGSVMLRSLSAEQEGVRVFEIDTLNDIAEPIVYSAALSAITVAVLPTSTPTGSPTPTGYIFPPTPPATETSTPVPTQTPTSTAFVSPPTPQPTETPTPTPTVS